MTTGDAEKAREARYAAAIISERYCEPTKSKPDLETLGAWMDEARAVMAVADAEVEEATRDLRAEVERLRVRGASLEADLKQANVWSWEMHDRAKGAEAERDQLWAAMTALADEWESDKHRVLDDEQDPRRQGWRTAVVDHAARLRDILAQVGAADTQPEGAAGDVEAVADAEVEEATRELRAEVESLRTQLTNGHGAHQWWRRQAYEETAKREAAEAERDQLWAALTALAVAVGGMGGHVGDCRTPDEPCSCGVAGARDEFAAALAQVGAADTQPEGAAGDVEAAVRSAVTQVLTDPIADFSRPLLERLTDAITVAVTHVVRPAPTADAAPESGEGR